MQNHKRLRVTMSGRAVVAIGQPFVARDESYADADVALDEISDLVRQSEPLVLRVDAAGGTSAERERLSGDWLCDSDGSPPSRLPAPRWGYDDRADEWSRPRTWLGAWEECDDARWMLHAAQGVGVDLRLLVLAAGACARSALPAVPAAEVRPLRALDAAEAWARGRLSQQDIEEPLLGAVDATYDVSHARGVRYDTATYGACMAADTVANVAWNPGHVADIAGVAFYASSAYAPNSVLKSLQYMADLVRGHIPTIAVLRAAARNKGPADGRATW